MYGLDRALVSIGLVPAVLGCSGPTANEVSSPSHGLSSTGAEGTNTPISEISYTKVSDLETKRALALATAAAGAVVRSALFRAKLLGFDALGTNATGAEKSGTEVEKAYFSTAGSVHMYPVTYDPSCLPCWFSTASTVLGGGRATTTLRSCTVDRIKAVLRTDSGQDEAVACAINTIAHEWTHAVGDEKQTQVYTDGNHTDSQKPLVSYTIGALAQCAYLDSRGYNVAPQFDLCLRLVGATTFNPSTCAPGWAMRVFGRKEVATSASQPASSR
jgi:hypothetical protein